MDNQYRLFHSLDNAPESVYNRELFNLLLREPTLVDHPPLMMEGVDGYGIYLEEELFVWWASIQRIRANIQYFELGWVAAHLRR